MALTGFHLRVAQVVGDALGRHGFALGGGYALQTHGLADRPSKDLDAYVNSMDVSLFETAEHDLRDALRAHGLDAEVMHSDSWFRGILVTNPDDGEQVTVDLGYDYREKPPIFVDGIGPVLDIEDVVTGKVRAFIERYAERDFSDIDRILESGRWSAADLRERARALFPDLPADEFTNRLREAHTLDPEEYAAIGIAPRAAAQMSQRLARQADLLAGKDPDRPVHRRSPDPDTGPVAGIPGTGGPGPVTH